MMHYDVLCTMYRGDTGGCQVPQQLSHMQCTHSHTQNTHRHTFQTVARYLIGGDCDETVILGVCSLALRHYCC